MGAILRYEGPLPSAEVVGYGHFAPGDEKSVDEKTALDFEAQPCVDEGWVVERDGNGKKKKTASDDETNEPSTDLSVRGPRTQRNKDE